MPMPEAPVDKHNLPQPSHYDIGPTGQFVIVKAKTKAKAMYRLPHDKLRLRVDGSNARHRRRSLRFR
jgi:hypothetical protein